MRRIVVGDRVSSARATAASGTTCPDGRAIGMASSSVGLSASGMSGHHDIEPGLTHGCQLAHDAPIHKGIHRRAHLGRMQSHGRCIIWRGWIRNGPRSRAGLGRTSSPNRLVEPRHQHFARRDQCGGVGARQLDFHSPAR